MLIIFQKAALFLTLNLFISLIGLKFKHDPDPLQDTYLSPLPAMSDTHSPLCAWIQSRITALYEINSWVDPDDPEFAKLYDSVFAPNAVFYLNHEKVSRDAYLRRLSSEHFAAVGETVEWKEIIEAPQESKTLEVCRTYIFVSSLLLRHARSAFIGGYRGWILRRNTLVKNQDPRRPSTAVELQQLQCKVGLW